jgi:hypothetical protein
LVAVGFLAAASKKAERNITSHHSLLPFLIVIILISFVFCIMMEFEYPLEDHDVMMQHNDNSNNNHQDDDDDDMDPPPPPDDPMDDNNEQQPQEEEEEEEAPHAMEHDLELPVTQEDAWAVIR